MIKQTFFKKNGNLFLLLAIFIIKGYFLVSVYKNQNLNNHLIYEKEADVVADAHHYIMIAKNIYNYQTFSDTNSQIISEFSAWRPPFWPFILSLLFFITESLFTILVLKVILETLFIALIYKKLKHHNIVKNYALLFLLLIEPYYIKYSITFLSESITAILIVYLFYVFVSLKKDKTTSILIPIMAATTILCHPVSIFFVGTLFGFYALFNIKTHIKIVVLHTIIFSVLVLVWPLRNALVFNKGIFITASQGSSLSKGWNDRVLTDFNNVNGDLADADLNLKYIHKQEVEAAKNSTINESKLYKKATKTFFDRLSFKEKLTIVWIKIKSNFTPFPEIPKSGVLEKLAVIFRILYLIIFVQSIYLVLKKGTQFWTDLKVRIAFFILSIFVGQIIMASLVYTGLRFNAIYTLSLLAGFFIFNYDIVIKKVKRKFN